MFFLEHQYGYGLRRTDHLISCAAGGRLPRTIIPRPKLLEQTCQVAEWSGHDYHSLLRGVHCCNHYRVIGCLSLATAHGAFTHSVSAAGILAQNHLVTTMQVLYFLLSSYVYLVQSAFEKSCLPSI